MTFLPHSSRLLVLAVTLMVLAGCARLGIGSTEAPAPETEPQASVADEIEEPEARDEAVDQTALDEALEHFRAGRYYQAEFLFSRYLEHAEDTGRALHIDEPAGARARAEALWGLAMLHLLPESPVVDRERATGALEELRDAHGESIRGAQARWILGMLDELQTMRTQMNQQAELLRQLNETVEQLRRIDLNRRPTGGRGDTVPSPTRQR